jgi:hypothetical protein
MNSKILHTSDAMKKFLLYSGSITGITLLFGILFVYGVFDFSEGKSQLIGDAQTSSYETNLHNNIVEYTHNLGNLMMDAQAAINSFQDGDDLEPFKQKFEQIKLENDSLDSLMSNSAFEHKQESIRTEYFEKYRPALVGWINNASDIIEACAPPEELPPAEEESEVIEETIAETPQPVNLAALKEPLQNSYDDFVESHNEFIDVLNKTRNY